MSDHGDFDGLHVSYRQLSAFASSLFRYLYFHLNMQSYRVNVSEHFKEVIGRAVFRIRQDAYKFNTDVLESCAYSVDRLTLCQKVCSLYPNNDYFKKLYYISTFILDMMFWCYMTSDATDLGMGPDLWITIFQNNFESEFEIHGGWQGLAEAGNECCQLLSNEILPGETVLPVYFQVILASVGRFIPPAADVGADDALEALENLDFEPMETDDTSVHQTAQVSKPMQEGIKEGQPGKGTQVEETEKEIEENQPEIDETPGLYSSALGGNVIQTENPSEGTSEQLREGASQSLGDRNLRKRRHNSPPETESDTEPENLSPTKAKIDRK